MQGKEEALLQAVHRDVGVRDFSGDEGVDDVYEHERYSYLTFSWGSSFPGTEQQHLDTMMGREYLHTDEFDHLSLLRVRAPAADGPQAMEQSARLAVEPDEREDGAAATGGLDVDE